MMDYPHSQGICDAIEACYDNESTAHQTMCLLLAFVNQRVEQIDPNYNAQHSESSNLKYIQGFLCGLEAFLVKQIISTKEHAKKD